MAITVEEFGQALIKQLSDHPGSRGGYILAGNLISAKSMLKLAIDQGALEIVESDSDLA